MSDLAERLASFERALVEMLAKRSWAKREQWCGCIDCHSMIAPRALRPSSAPRRPDPTPDKINEAFEQALDAEMVAYRPLHATWWRKMLTALVLLCSIGTTDCRQLADAPDQSALPLTYGMEEAAKHPVPANKYVKVACVHKGVARIIQ